MSKRWSWLFEEIVVPECHYEDCPTIAGKINCTCVCINEELELTIEYQRSVLRKIPILRRLAQRNYERQLHRIRQREDRYAKLRAE